MALRHEFNDQLLENRGGRNNFWWNSLLVALVMALIITIAAGLRARRRRPPEETAAPSGQIEAREIPAAAKPAPTVMPPGRDRELWERLRKQLNDLDRPAARERCLVLLDQVTDDSVRSAIERQLGDMHIELVFSPAPMPEKTEYLVQPGDALARIARRFGTTVELIQRGNNLRGDLIRPGDRLRVFAAPFSVVVDKSANQLRVYAGDRFFKRYDVGTGKHGTTPAGIFEISDKIVEPPWWRPDGGVIPFGDKENVLGTRWMALTPIEGTAPVRGYGIHGTWEPETIGQQASAGCVRLLNQDVEELYALLPAGTRVVIRE